VGDYIATAPHPSATDAGPKTIRYTEVAPPINS
jgi:hypothetical protein